MLDSREEELGVKRDNTRKKKKEKRSEKKTIHKEEETEERRGEEEEEEEEGQQEKDSEGVLLRGIFKLGKKSQDVLLTRTRLTWIPITPETPTEPRVLHPEVLLLEDVFAVKVKRRRAAGQQSGGPVLGLTLFHSRRKGRKLEEDTLHLHNASSEHTYRWYNKIKELVTGFTIRPKFLKVFINPSSHKKEAVHIYRDHVAPLFKMADVRTDITVTERTGHALSVMKECKLDEYDGVLCVGGDGSVAELCHALVLRAQLDTGSPEKPVNDVCLLLPLIFTGSTDVVSCSVHGVRDPVTAALHVILGHQQQVDMCSFTSLGQLVRYGFSAMFGFGGQSLARAEKNRWMSSSRRREYAMSFFHPHIIASFHLVFSCVVIVEEEETWTTREGLYLNISIMSIPCLSPHAPQGLAPDTRYLQGGSASLIAVGNTSRSEFIKHLKRYSFSFSFVETHTVSAVRVRPRSQTGWSEGEENEEEEDSKTTPIIGSEGASFPWNIDGELVEIANEVLVRVHPRLITLYGEHIDEAETTASCSCI
uniref:Ceramide kinase-like n=1 Tax=Cynoglossus semilaevis TaxID=244447 RepID=A0A3P8V4W2_CYNSE